MMVFVPCLASARMPDTAKAKTDSVVIVNSGSTNFAGYRIVVEKSGNAEYTATPRRYGPQSQGAAGPVRKKVPRPLLQRLYSDLGAAKPLSALPEAHCMKSASFGSTLTVEFNGQKTPDLSCGDGGSAEMENLARDVKEISAMFAALNAKKAPLVAGPR